MHVADDGGVKSTACDTMPQASLSDDLCTVSPHAMTELLWYRQHMYGFICVNYHDSLHNALQKLKIYVSTTAEYCTSLHGWGFIQALLWVSLLPCRANSYDASSMAGCGRQSSVSAAG